MASWNVRLDGPDQRLCLVVLSLRTPVLTRIMRTVTVLADPPAMGRKARAAAEARSWDGIFDRLFERYGRV